MAQARLIEIDNNVAEAQANLLACNREFAAIKQNLPGWIEQEKILAHNQEMQAAAVQARQAFVELLMPFVECPIRVKLGMKVEDEFVEVGRIGPW